MKRASAANNEELCVKSLNVVRLVSGVDILRRGCCGDPVTVVTAAPVTEPGPPEDRGGVGAGVASLPLI